MHDQLTHDQAPTAPEPQSPTEPVASDSPLLLPYEESCKKVRDLAMRQLNRFMSYEAKVLKGDDADAIHDMRVSSRRLQQVLDLLYPRPRPPELRRMRRQIRRCRQALGDVRNCDVLLALVDRTLGRKRSARRDAWTAVQHFLLMRRSENYLRAMRKFGKINLALSYVHLKEILQHDKAHDHSVEQSRHGPEAPHPDFGRDLINSLEPVWSGFEDRIAQSHRHSRPEVIHGARIASKRLRYLVEVFHEFGVPGSADVLAWLRQLQTHLGNWHDLEVLESMMIEMVARPDFLRKQLPLAMDVEKLILRNRRNKAGFEEQYSRMSRNSIEMRRLKEWVSYVLASPSGAVVKV
jgi:CHAD domain-containing protein